MNEIEKELEDIKKLLELYNEGEDIDEESFLSYLNSGEEEYFKIETKFTNVSNNPDPEYAKEGDSGFDLRAFIEEPITLKPLERKLIPTGLRVELPKNTELQVRPRSGMAIRHGISVLNTPGTVDEGYRGEIGIIAINLSYEEYTIQPGERIAQGVITHVIGEGISKLIKVVELNETERGETGFGSSGKN